VAHGLKARAMQPAESILATLEARYGAPSPDWPTDPYLFLLWWQCGYPPSEERCTRGWEALRASIGSSPKQLLGVRTAQLARALAAGGMVPELRATRVRSIARTVQKEFAGDPRSALERLPLAAARKALKRFPGIGPPGADRILLFAGVAPVAAVPSNCPHVLVRLLAGTESAKYRDTYARARALIEAQIPAILAARQRAYLLLQRHGRELCKTKDPKCGECPVATACAWRARRIRRASSSAA
jgi:endonuclease III